jgi:hypothetical protein
MWTWSTSLVEGTVRMVVIKFLIGVMVVVISAIWAWPVKWLLARRLVASRARVDA